jgi:hypothetical protein
MLVIVLQGKRHRTFLPLFSRGSLVMAFLPGSAFNLPISKLLNPEISAAISWPRWAGGAGIVHPHGNEHTPKPTPKTSSGRLCKVEPIDVKKPHVHRGTGVLFWLLIQPSASIGADNRSRTYDLLITNELLYQLSYIGIFARAKLYRLFTR